MNIKQLRDLLNSGIPDDVAIVIESRDHIYRVATAALQKAVKVKNKLYEYSEEDETDLEEPGVISGSVFVKLVSVLVFS